MQWTLREYLQTFFTRTNRYVKDRLTGPEGTGNTQPFVKQKDSLYRGLLVFSPFHWCVHLFIGLHWYSGEFASSFGDSKSPPSRSQVPYGSIQHTGHSRSPIFQSSTQDIEHPAYWTLLITHFSGKHTRYRASSILGTLDHPVNCLRYLASSILEILDRPCFSEPLEISPRYHTSTS